MQSRGLTITATICSRHCNATPRRGGAKFWRQLSALWPLSRYSYPSCRNLR